MLPVIGVTTRMRDVPSSAGVSPSHVLNRAYTDAVRRVGGIPVLLSPVPDDAVPALLSRLDGVVLSGGGDIDPARYGGKSHDAVYDVDPERDGFELAVARNAAERRLPTLAICRGLQVLNVALGGTLIEDVPTEIGDRVAHSRVGEHVYERHQEIQIDPNCHLATVLHSTDVAVNSIHHQAIRTVAPGLRPVARATDGVIEAVESEDAAWPLLAVQWHPEYLSERDDTALLLFAELVETAASATRVL